MANTPTIDRSAFFDSVRASLFRGKLSQRQVDILTTILDKCAEEGVTDKRHIAYILATPYHEVGPGLEPRDEDLRYSASALAQNWPARYAQPSKFKVKKPNQLAIRLAYNPEAIANNCYANRMGNGDEQSGDGWRFRGRDWCQTTGRDNYERCGKHANVDLVAHPERIKEPKIAACNLVCGMRDGWFTGVSLKTYTTKAGFDWVNARQIINRLNKAEEIAATAKLFYAALTA